MSLILDALNRADQERKTFDGAPDIHSIHSAAPTSPDMQQRPLLLWLSIALVALVICPALWWWFHPIKAPQTQVASNPVPAVVAKPAAIVAPPESNKPYVAPPAKPELQQAQTLAPDAKVSDLYQAESTSSSAKAANPSVNDLYQPEKPLAMVEAVQLPEAPGVIPADMAAPQRITGPAKEVKARRLESVAGIAYFNDLPWGRKQAIPTISYARHDYLANGISTVVINGETRGIGNQVSRGQFVIEDILEDGVVLRYGELRFKLPALSGWVNM